MARKDRLAGMVGNSAPGTPRSRDAEPAPAPTVKAPFAVPRALLYVPPPAAPGPWVSLLQADGLDVLVATTPDTAAALLDTAPPALILAIVPVLGGALERLFHDKAPSAELRVLPSLASLLRDWVMPPREALELSVRTGTALAAVLATSHGRPGERAARLSEWSGRASAKLGLSERDQLAARLAGALYDVPEALAPGASESGDTVRELGQHWSSVQQLAEAIGMPFAIEPPPDDGQPVERAPGVAEIVDAAAELASLLGAGHPRPGLELRRRAPGAGLHPAAVEAVLGASGAGEGRRERARILLVDGDAAARSLLALRLANEGYSVDTAAGGRDALERLRASPPALILSETVLSGIDGYTLLDTLKREGRRVPLVFVSSRADPLSVNKGLLLGAADFLGKPVNIEVLLTKLQKLLGEALAAADVSARISLSDVEHTSAEAYPAVSYDELGPDVVILGRFRILADLGEGGMGKVFRARDERLEEDVVVKVMKDSLMGDPKLLEHFKREIRLARKITHPAVVRIHDFWESGALKFVTMEFLEGVDLRHEIKRRGAFPLPVALRLAGELLEGLAAAHEIGVVHRDIKPHNMLLLAGGHIKILDFGIAQGLDPTTPDGHTLTATPMGTPEYMSPEQLVGERLDGRTDLYSAGIVLFELLTGSLPFAGPDRMAVATARLHHPPPVPSASLPGIAPEIDGFVLSLLSRDRDARPESARVALEQLRHLRPRA